MSSHKPMSRFAHWLVDCAIRHNAAVKEARGHVPGGQDPPQVSKLSVALFEKLHTLEALVRKYGIEGTFGTPENPLTPEERKEVGN